MIETQKKIDRCISASLPETGICSLFYPLQPVFSVLLGVVFLGERLGLRFCIVCMPIAADILINCLY